MVTGINLNFAGLEQKEITGVLDRQRNEKSAATLGEIVMNYRFFLKERGQTDIERLAILAENVPGRLISVIGDSGFNQVRLISQLFRSNYDIRIDEIEPSVTQKIETTVPI